MTNREISNNNPEKELIVGKSISDDKTKQTSKTNTTQNKKIARKNEKSNQSFDDISNEILRDLVTKKDSLANEIKELQKTEEIFLSPLFKKKTNQQLNIFRYLKLRATTKMNDISLGGINNKNLKKLNMIKPFGFAGISYFEQKKGP